MNAKEHYILIELWLKVTPVNDPTLLQQECLTVSKHIFKGSGKSIGSNNKLSLSHL